MWRNSRPWVPLALLTATVAFGAQARAQAQEPLTLVCEAKDSRTGDEVSARFRVNFRTSEVVYLDYLGRAMWAAPAVIETDTIVWYAVDFRQFLDPEQLVNEGVTGQLRNFNRWPYGPKDWIIKLKGSIDRATLKIQGLGRSQWDVPKFTNGTYRWAELEPGVCKTPVKTPPQG
jgi:hypothetical protein